MFHGDPKELSKLGNEARSRKVSAKDRQAIAVKASYARWYKVTDDQMDRIDTYLRGLASIAAQALADGDRAEYRSTITAMGQFERMKLMLESERSKGGKPVEELDESVKESVKAFRKGRDEEIVDVTEEKEKK